MNPLLISLDRLVTDGLLDADDLRARPSFSERAVDFGEVIPWKLRLLRKAFDSSGDVSSAECSAFLRNNENWLFDFALFTALKTEHGGAPWNEWEQDVRVRSGAGLRIARERLAHEIDYQIFLQFVAAKHWSELKSYANGKGIRLFGDMPIFLAYDSADVWSRRELFRLDEDLLPSCVAGVPPDYFSETGQLWGNPLYRWELMQERGFDWWIRRFELLAERVDVVRVDHFRGFEAFWEIARGEATAMNGTWVKAPGVELFTAVRAALPELEIVAENLGVITPEVEELRKKFGFAGMAVLQFAFDGDAKNSYLPDYHEADSVVYTGTHDNDTTLGWYQSLDEKSRRCLLAHLKERKGKMPKRLVVMAYESKARYAIVPLQDVLGQGSAARMNVPGVGDNNWSWRFESSDLGRKHSEFLFELAGKTDRLGLTRNPGENRTNFTLKA